MGKAIFITGGSRSGKSSFALKMASSLKGRRVYIATAEPLDDEMRERIERHKEERRGQWHTIEEPIMISSKIKEVKDNYDVIILDCLTLWLSNLMLRTKTIDTEIETFIEILGRWEKDADPYLFIVSNEVGMGIVPENEISRRFRDECGRLNQRVANNADEAYFVISGIPLKIKG